MSQATMKEIVPVEDTLLSGRRLGAIACNGALQHKGEHEYEFPHNRGYDGFWVTVDNISVHVVRTDEGVVVDLYPLKHEDLVPLASTYAFFAEAIEEQDTGGSEDNSNENNSTEEKDSHTE